MAHVKLKKPRTKRVKPPAPVPPPKILRPKRGLLRAVYKELFTSDVDQRTNALIKAGAWYDQCIGYLTNMKQNGILTIRQRKEQDQALAHRLDALRANVPSQKERFWVESIKHFEKMCAVYKPPKILKYLRVFEKKRKVLESRRVKLNDKFGKFLELIRVALEPKNSNGKSINLYVDKLASQYRIDSQGNITFDRKFVLHLRRLNRKYGLLSPVLHCIPVLTESACRTAELDQGGHKTGRTILSSRKRYDSFLEMMYHMNRFMMTDTAPRRLVRKPRTPKKERPE